MYQSPPTNQRTKIGVSFHRALIWSAFGHLALVWMATSDRLQEGDESSPLFAVKIASVTVPAVTKANQAPVELAATKPPKLVSATESLAKTSALSEPAARAVTATDDRHKSTSSPQHRVQESVQLPSRATTSTQTGVISAEGLRGYRLALAREARRVWRYPTQALDAGLQGSAEIRLELLPNGRLLSAQIEKSSGHVVLDEAARDILIRAANSTQATLSRSDDSSLPFAIVVPISFSLAAEEGRSPGQQN
jgi:periplasmic protein TonB